MINMGAELACSFRRMFGRIFFLKESMAAQMFRPEYDQVLMMRSNFGLLLFYFSKYSKCLLPFDFETHIHTKLVK